MSTTWQHFSVYEIFQMDIVVDCTRVEIIGRRVAQNDKKKGNCGNGNGSNRRVQRKTALIIFSDYV